MLDLIFAYDVVASDLQSAEEKTALLRPLVRGIEAAGGVPCDGTGDRPVIHIVLAYGHHAGALRAFR